MTPEELNNAVQSAALKYAGSQTAGRRLAGIGWHTCDTPMLTNRPQNRTISGPTVSRRTLPGSQ